MAIGCHSCGQFAARLHELQERGTGSRIRLCDGCLRRRAVFRLSRPEAWESLRGVTLGPSLTFWQEDGRTYVLRPGAGAPS